MVQGTARRGIAGEGPGGHGGGGPLQAGKKKKGPRDLSRGPVDPAAPYSPGPEGQVPSATSGLTSVFGMGTGMTHRR